jgi:endonuclease V
MMTQSLEEKWIQYQNENRHKLIIVDTFDKNKIKYIGGVDVSFDKKNNNKACGYLTIVKYKTNEIVYEDYELETLTIPYISGFLGFREVPVYNILLNRLKKNNPEFYPDIILVDGFGILHHREFGSASYLGYLLDIATIGVGKTLLHIDGLTESEIKKNFRQLCHDTGDYIELIGETGKQYGAAYKSNNEVSNPIYISIGHKISLETAIEVIKNSTKFKLPEVIRNSNMKSKLYF